MNAKEHIKRSQSEIEVKTGGKTQVTKMRFVLVLHLIGWEGAVMKSRIALVSQLEIALSNRFKTDLLLAERKRYLEFCAGNSYWSRFTSDHASSNSWSSRNATKCNAIPPPKGWCKSFLLVNACAVFYSVCESTFLRSTLRDSKRYLKIFCAI